MQEAGVTRSVKQQEVYKVCYMLLVENYKHYTNNNWSGANYSISEKIQVCNITIFMLNIVPHTSQNLFVTHPTCKMGKREMHCILGRGLGFECDSHLWVDVLPQDAFVKLKI